MFKEYDDLQIVSNDLTEKRGLTLCALQRNESYMLPAFLEHYRRIGIERFVILDDQSDDGTREYLSEQPDVMVMESKTRYGTMVEPNGRIPLPSMRSNMIWRNVLMARFGLNTWTFMLDIDEFIALPTGSTLHDVVAEASKGSEGSVNGVMLDVYPETITGLKNEGPFVRDDKWFFDGQRHLVLNKGDNILMEHPGARARLYVQYGVRELSTKEKLYRLRKRDWYPRANWIAKQILIRWNETSLFLGSHTTTTKPTQSMLIPIHHFKFNPDLFRRAESAIREKSYYGGSIEYSMVSDLLGRMEKKNGSFTYRHSKRLDDIDALFDTGNAIMNL